MSPVTDAGGGAAGVERLAGRFALLRPRARGGMATLYEAYDEQLERHVAVKVLHEAVGQIDLERFRREARAAAALNHPGIAPVYDYGVDGSRHYLVLELVDGCDLARLLRSGPFEPARAVRITAAVSDALAHAHAAGIIHRDVKPANILLEAGERARLTDFGVARLIDTTAVTATGTIIGTPTYSAPEQVADEPVGPAADVYALGLVLYELLTGQPPFTGESATAIAAQRLTTPVPPPSAARRDVPAALDVVLAAATAREPRDRYGTAEELGAGLRAAGRRLESGRPRPQATAPTREIAAPTRPVPTAAADEPAAADGAGGTGGETGARSRRRSLRGRRVALALLLAASMAGAVAGLAVRGDSPGVGPDDGGSVAEPGGGPPDGADRAPGRVSPDADAEPSRPPPARPAPAEGAFRITGAIVGLDAGKVAEALEAHGFEVETRPPSSEEPEGTVTDVEPPVGGHVRPGDTVVLHLADPD